LRSQRVGDVLAGQAKRLKRGRIEVDLDLPLFAAVGIGDRRSGNRDQRRAQLVDADISEVLFGQAFARQRERSGPWMRCNSGSAAAWHRAEVA
jgi:hypothetical protein